jgi:thiol-disulfide isomerase/thioredoxin
MNAKKWIVLLCVLLVVGCAKKQGDTKTTGSKPDANTPAAKSATPAATPAPATPTVAQQAMAASARPSKLGDPAWPLAGLTWVKGGPVEIKPGTVYVVEFWATWCPPCKESIPHLTQVQQKYKDKNVVIVGISTEKMNVVTPFVEQKGPEMAYNVAVDTTGDVAGGYMDAFNVNTIPTAFVVGADGKLAWVGHPMDNLEAVLDRTLSAASPAKPG